MFLLIVRNNDAEGGVCMRGTSKQEEIGACVYLAVRGERWPPSPRRASTHWPWQSVLQLVFKVRLQIENGGTISSVSVEQAKHNTTGLCVRHSRNTTHMWWWYGGVGQCSTAANPALILAIQRYFFLLVSGWY